jgi:8-oxo-dGTP diphosphatase
MLNPDEAAYLASYDSAAFPKPSVAVDVVLLAIQAGALSALLVRRSEHPELGRWALPGGFVKLDEHLDDAATRVLRTKAGVENVYLEQLYTFGRPDRDPRMRILSVAYYALADLALLERVPTGADTRFQAIADLLDGAGAAIEMAFDHREIVGMAVKRLRGKLDYTPVGYELLPAQFTLLQLQRVHEIILGARVNKDSFRRRMLASGELEPTGAMQDGVDHRPAALYRRVRQGGSHG